MEHSSMLQPEFWIVIVVRFELENSFVNYSSKKCPTQMAALLLKVSKSQVKLCQGVLFS